MFTKIKCNLVVTHNFTFSFINHAENFHSECSEKVGFQNLYIRLIQRPLFGKHVSVMFKGKRF